MTTTFRLTAAATGHARRHDRHRATARQAAGDPPKGEPVPFETVEIVSGTSGINLYDTQILRLATE